MNFCLLLFAFMCGKERRVGEERGKVKREEWEGEVGGERGERTKEGSGRRRGRERERD